jgi:hypothetical protein
MDVWERVHRIGIGSDGAAEHEANLDDFFCGPRITTENKTLSVGSSGGDEVSRSLQQLIACIGSRLVWRR